jgi:hypothetical protein
MPAPPMPTDALWSRRTTADYLHVPEKTLAEWASRGIGPRYARCGKHARYRPEDVQAWVESKMIEPRVAQ